MYLLNHFHNICFLFETLILTTSMTFLIKFKKIISYEIPTYYKYHNLLDCTYLLLSCNHSQIKH